MDKFIFDIEVIDSVVIQGLIDKHVHLQIVISVFIIIMEPQNILSVTNE